VRKKLFNGHQSLAPVLRGGPTRCIHIPEAERIVPNYDNVIAQHYSNGNLLFRVGDEVDPLRFLRGDPMGAIDGNATRRQQLSLLMAAGVELVLVWCVAAGAHKIFISKVSGEMVHQADALTTSRDYFKLYRLAKFINGQPIT
jgi:hypothetical protein